MLRVLNENYFIDLDEIEKYLDMTETKMPPESGQVGDKVNDMSETEVYVENIQVEAKVNLIKFELVKLLIEVVLSEDAEIDDKLGLKSSSSSTSVPFKIAFNSLLNKKLINHY